jgi:hypothetical protein
VNRLLLNNLDVVGVGWGAFWTPRPAYLRDQWNEISLLPADGRLRPIMGQTFRRLPTLTLSEFVSYWRDTHGPLVRERAAALHIERYEQAHPLSGWPANCWQTSVASSTWNARRSGW